MRILVVEDEAKAAKFLQKGLGEAGFVVDVAGDELDGLQLGLAGGEKRRSSSRASSTYQTLKTPTP